jgi:chromosomal replication initiator protein DnaA
VINREQLERAVAERRQKGGYIGQILVDLGFVTQDAIVSFLVKECKIPHLSLLDYEVSPELFLLIPAEVCAEHNLMPIDKLGRILTVAMVDPLDTEALAVIQKLCPDLRIKTIMCNWQHFQTVSGRLFRKLAPSSEDSRETDFGSGFPPAARAGKPVTPARPAERPPTTSREDLQLNDIVSQLVGESKKATGPAPTRGAVRSTAAPSGKPAEVRTIASAPRETAVSGSPAQEELASTIRAAVQEAVSAAVRQQAQGADLAAMLRETIHEAMSEFVAVPGGANGAEAPLGLSAQELTDTLRRAMEETAATMAVHLRAVAQDQGGAGLDLVKAVQEVVKGTQAAQEARLAQLAEATMEANRTAQAAMNATISSLHAKQEATAVAEANLHDIMQAGQGIPVNPMASVRPFWADRVPWLADLAENDRRVFEALASEKPIEGLTFDSFFPGKTNAFAYKVGQAVANNPGREYNPFFLYGKVGIGKTHLINAMGHAIRGRLRDTRVGYVSASHFARRVMEALHGQALDLFRKNYCHWDVLILDDIQFLGGRIEAQEEFFHIFNVLHHEGRQIIIAGDKPPQRLGLLEQRLVSRFASGIVAELRPPEMETRMAILRHHITQAKTVISDEILTLVANRTPNDVRMMVGALRKIVAYANLVGEDISYETASEILSHLGVVEAA